MRAVRVGSTQSNISTPRSMPSSRSSGEPTPSRWRGFASGSSGMVGLQHAPHQRLRLANREAANREAIEGQRADEPRARGAQLRIHRALRDAEERLIAGRTCAASARSAQRCVRSVAARATSGGQGYGGHSSSGRMMSAPSSASVCMTLSGVISTSRAIQMRAEAHARVRHLAQLAQAEDLEAAAIGQDGMWPAHEAVQPAEARHQLRARPQQQVIGIREDDAGADGLQIVRRRRL